MQHHGDRLSKARVACLHGDKEKSLLLCSWTEASLSTVRLGAVSPTGCATSCTCGSRSFTGSFNARACDWLGIRNISACCKQESQEGCFQARFLMSSSSLRIPWVSAAQEDGRGGDGSFQKRQQTPVQLDEVVRCSPPHDEERAASVQREDPIADVLALVAVCHPLEEG